MCGELIAEIELKMLCGTNNLLGTKLSCLFLPCDHDS